MNEVIEKSDIIVEVLDARFADDTRNKEVEDKVKKSGKPLILALNKADLVSKGFRDKNPGLYVSSKRDLGVTALKREILSKLDLKKEKNIVGVVGYPNVGKSSVINALTGREAALTSPQSGFTKGMQLVKMKEGLYMLDTPGVIPYLEKDRKKHALTSAIDFSKVKDPENSALDLIDKYPKEIKKSYGVKGETSDEILEAIAVRLNKLKKGGTPDLINTARTIIMDWQRGKIRFL